jgi:hypothetical protein
LTDGLCDVEPHAAGASRGNKRDTRVSQKPLADRRDVAYQKRENRGINIRLPAHFFGNSCHSDGRQRCLIRGLPDDCIAANSRDRTIPTPDCYGKVEGRDHAHDSEWVPLFHQAMVAALRLDRQAVELAGQPNCEVADVDHLLHLAKGFGQDFARLQRNQLC